MFGQKEFESLFLAHYRPLCLFALDFTGDIEAAEDIVQQLFTDLWERARVEPPAVARWKPYLYAAVKNRCLKAARAAGRLPLARVEVDIPDDDDDEGRALRAEREAALWRWIDELPPARRRILLMAKQERMSYREIAGRLRLSEKTVENQVGKALKSLRERGREFCLFFFG
ncbi:MAG: sigma-70 family RNA polymerase sigma factor [Odoribacteraceae bacterium]|jgi:RNA polymerase sigma-70 factor (ECF subfamily)|nr:sigma-70 family RNA polymerase sigma factor [Odoribacteraceae bacterium]